MLPGSVREAKAETLPTSGDCGYGVTWTYENGTLTVSGEGEMWDNDPTQPILYQNPLLVTSIVVEEGVTRIGNCAFYGCSNATKVSLPSHWKKLLFMHFITVPV